MTTKDILKGALELLGPNGEHWVPRIPATDTEHCALTAIGRTEGYLNNGAREAAWKFLERGGNFKMGIGRWNDSSTWTQVKAAFERAIMEAGQ